MDSLSFMQRRLVKILLQVSPGERKRLLEELREVIRTVTAESSDLKFKDSKVMTEPAALISKFLWISAKAAKKKRRI